MYIFDKAINQYITAKATDVDGEIWVYGDISDSKWFDEDVTPKEINAALNEMGNVKNLNLRINSYGGSVFAGNAIYNIIDTYRRKTGCSVNAYIDGIAASMGSGIPMVADKIYMAENALMMLHKPLVMAYGNADDLQKQIEMLDKAETALIANYMHHFNGTEDELREIMKNETWFTAEEALEKGLCDEIVGAVQMAASAKGIVINGEEFSDNIKNKYPDIKRGEPKSMFEYDQKLEQFGVSAEAFEQMNVSAETLLGIADAGRQAFIDSFGDGEVYDVKNAQILDGTFIFTEDIKNAFGEDKNAEELLDLAKKGTQFSEEDAEKAKAYDGIVNDAIDEAITNGIRAKGEAFNETKWRKILNGLDYADVLDQSKEWIEDAKIALNAGKKIAETNPCPGVEDKNLVNPEDYNFC